MKLLLLLTVLALTIFAKTTYTATILPWNDGTHPITSVRIDGPDDGPEFLIVALRYRCSRHTCSAIGQAFEVTPGTWLAEFEGISSPLSVNVESPFN